jgi:hypothetical protein
MAASSVIVEISNLDMFRLENKCKSDIQSFLGHNLARNEFNESEIRLFSLSAVGGEANK